MVKVSCFAYVLLVKKILCDVFFLSVCLFVRLTVEITCGATPARLMVTEAAHAASERLNRATVAPAGAARGVRRHFLCYRCNSRQSSQVGVSHFGRRPKETFWIPSTRVRKLLYCLVRRFSLGNIPLFFECLPQNEVAGGYIVEDAS